MNDAANRPPAGATAPAFALVLLAGCAAVGPEVDEFALAGLQPEASRCVGVPRVQGSPVSFECRRSQIIQLHSAAGEPIDTWLVLGEVVGIHIDKRLLVDGVFDTAGADIVLRGGGPADYFSVSGTQKFRMFRPEGGAQQLPR